FGPFQCDSIPQRESRDAKCVDPLPCKLVSEEPVVADVDASLREIGDGRECLSKLREVVVLMGEILHRAHRLACVGTSERRSLSRHVPARRASRAGSRALSALRLIGSPGALK